MADTKKPINVTVKKKDEPPATPVYRIAPLSKLDDVDIPQRAVVSNAFEPEDEYLQYYIGAQKDIGAIQPPYDLRTLDRLCQENNALGPCVEAMVTNIDGTGFDFVRDDNGSDDHDQPEDDANIDALWGFFGEPWPGESFVTIRKKLRRDHERTGNAYLEFLRNAREELVFARHVDSKMMRLVKLDDPVPQRIKLMRGGKEVAITVMVRYRRFVQLVNGVQLRYFKEFGCPLDLDKHTGRWAKPGERLGHQKRASEILHFTALPDAHTPYGVPRWINQLPSVLGSRKAEEFNLDFFDNGGVPPVLIMLQGGILSTDSRKALEQKTGGQAFKKNRVLVVEMEPSGGTLDTPSQSKVLVERFGAERQNDSMFEKYDERCEVRIRRGFRLPPIFVGQAADYSFATAFASYTVAEAQVFRPERDEFDEIMTVKVLPALGFAGYKMKSHPLNIEDATLKLQGLEVAQSTNQVDPVDILNEINKLVGTNLKISQTAPNQQGINPSSSTGKGAPGASKGSKGTKAGIKVTQQGTVQSNSEKSKPKATPVRQPAVQKTEDDLAELARSTIEAIRKNDLGAMAECVDAIHSLSAEDSEELKALLSDLALAQGPQLVAAE